MRGCAPRNSGPASNPLPERVSNPSRFGASTAANAVRGVAPAALTALLPLFLVAMLPRTSFAVLSLAVSLSAYVVVFQVGVQQAVTAAAGRTSSSDQARDTALPLAAALQFLSPLLLLAAAGAIVAMAFAGDLFPGVPNYLLEDFQVSLLLLFAAGVASLLSSVIWGQALGVGKVRAALVPSMAGRLVGFVAALVAASLTSDIKVVSAAIALPVIASLPAQARSVDLHLIHFSREHRRARRRYRRGYVKAVKTLAAWSLGMLMVTGLDGTIVGRFDFTHTGLYVLVATIVSVFISGIGSWQAAFLAHAHTLTGEAGAAMIRRVARIAMVINIDCACVAAIPIWLVLERLFAGSFARLGYEIFLLLILSNVLRQFAVPPILSAVAGERYERLTLPAVVEGVINLTASVLLCGRLGAIGVAFGTLIGALITVMVLVFYTFRAEGMFDLGRRPFVREALSRPLGVLLVPAAGGMLMPLSGLSELSIIPVQLASALLTAWLSWRLCLQPHERHGALRFVRQFRARGSHIPPGPVT